MHRARWAVLIGTVLFLVPVVAATPAAAIPPDPLACINGLGGSLTVDPPSVLAGQPLTVTWRVGTPDPVACPGYFSQQVDGAWVEASGSRAYVATVTRTFTLKGFYGGFNRDLATATVTVPEPQAQLPGRYEGTITTDFAVVTGLEAEFAGSPPALAATVGIHAGATANCYGRQALEAKSFTMTGYRTGVGADGSSTYHLAGRFEFDATVHVVVDVTISGATLSPDGRTFAGTAGVLIQPQFLSNCAASWPFSVSRVPDVPVPHVRYMLEAEARQKLVDAGFRVRVEDRRNWYCNWPPGTIITQDPPHGTLAPRGSLVTIGRASASSECHDPPDGS